MKSSTSHTPGMRSGDAPPGNINEPWHTQLLNTLPAAVYTCDLEGHITFFNKQAVHLWGYMPDVQDDTLKFCAFHKVWMANGTFVPPEKTPMAIALQTGETFHNLEALVQKPDGTTFYACVNINPLYDAEGNKCGAINVFQDISHLKETEQALLDSEALYRKLIEMLPVAVYTSDAEGRITQYNRAAAELWGYEPEIGKEFWRGSWKIYTPEGEPLPLEESPMAKALREARPVAGEEIVVERPDGKRLHVLPNLQPLFDDQGKLIGAINALIDITEPKKVNQELLEKNKEMEQFAYVASHDLLEPLNTITSFSALIEMEGKLDKDQQEYLSYVKNSSRQLKNLINDLLHHSRIGRHGTRQLADIGNIVADVLVSMSATVQQKKAIVQVGPLPTLEVYPKEIKLLFQNLLSNAIKFQQQGTTPVVNISARKENGHWQFTVEDNGIGIDKKYWEKVFTIFQRLHTFDEYDGTGIGLAHCKKIVEIHKGKLWLDSEVGKGTRFHFTLPEAGH